VNKPATTKSDISYGPAVVYLGAAGATVTPTVDIGGIVTDDGVTLEFTTSTRDIFQGNPKLLDHRFIQAAGVTARVSGIEWNFTNFIGALGSGAYNNVAGPPQQQLMNWGGDPLINEHAVLIVHKMSNGDTLNVRLWRAFGSGGFPIQLGHDEHKFAYGWEAAIAAQKWDGATALPNTQSLVEIERLGPPAP
jgi:hypothetical protein